MGKKALTSGKSPAAPAASPAVSPLIAHSNSVLAFGLMAVLATLIIPLPTWILDLLLACSISLAVAVLIVTLSSREALELSTFPSLLLFVTLFRLSLNVASTRLILQNGDAGHIIRTFGEFVAGGNIVIGLVIFLILVIIQFVVITKGSERISEVSARFTLDAMPGKQMAIDADLNAGLITETEANERRGKVVKESEFYGAMDGASKFIRGDAKAGLIITVINLIGGIVRGYPTLGISGAVDTYSVLSIGDGLVSQIPSVIISVSSGFLVTKISSRHSVGQDLSKQFFQASKPLSTAAVIVAAMALVPGLPKLQFLFLACCMAGLSRLAAREEREVDAGEADAPAESGDKTKRTQEPLEELLDVERISVHVGMRLIGMVDPRKSDAIFERIGALRRKFAQELGVVLPLVRLRDDINLAPNAYEIRLSEAPVAKGLLEPSLFLAMDPGTVAAPVKGIETTEPVYGLPALWISPEDKERAELSGYTVIDPESVFMTHLSETLRQQAHELLTREDVQALVDRLRKQQPSLVGAALGTDGDISMGLLQRVLKNLLAEGIPVRELTVILEALTEGSARTKSPTVLTEIVRKSLSRTITQRSRGRDGKVLALTFDPSLEHQLCSALKQEGGELSLALPSEQALAVTREVARAWRAVMDRGVDKVVLLCDARLRAPLAEMLRRTVSLLSVVAYDEIVPGIEVESVDTLRPAGTDEPVPQAAALASPGLAAG